MEFSFNKKSVKAIQEWLDNNGFCVNCEIDNKILAYAPDSNTILLPRRYDDMPDTLFMRWLRGLGLTADFDTVTLSVLHELGHAQTLGMFTNRESENCDIQKAILAMTIDEDSDDFQFEYWKVKDEAAANTWAVMYTNLFPQKVQNLEDIIEQYVKIG